MKITVNEAKAGTKTVAGDISAPVYLYLGESGSGKDRRIKLEGSTILDKLLDLRKAGTYVSIGPAEGSREWGKLDEEDQEFYKDLQAKAKKLRTYKAMGDFLSELCSDNESFLFAIRQGDDAVWVNPHILKELLDTPWHGVDSYWLSKAADVKGYWDKVIAARDAGKDYSKIKPEGCDEGYIDAAKTYEALESGNYFTTEELELVTSGWGLNTDTLDRICQVRYGMDADQLLAEGTSEES